MAIRSCRPSLVSAALCGMLASLFTPVLHAQIATAPNPPQVGSSAVATADPPIARPTTRPCVVTLFSNFAFDNFNNQDFNYTPPQECRGPWSKVVFTGDFSIQPGVQYDRTAAVFLNGVNIYYGTTPEPLQTATDTWHVERDLTDYSSILKSAQQGYVTLGNEVNVDGLNSVIFGTGKLEFYPADFRNPAPETADQVQTLAPGIMSLSESTPALTTSLTFPRNTERAYMDVIAQSQYIEEQWFLCVPTSVSVELGDCPNTAFRQVQVNIDGKPAGIAPVYPWIFTGGIDPGLWVPIPGVQTLNFVPYRIELTPFAGLLSDGEPHSVSLGVFNVYNYFNVVGSVLIYQDHGTQQTSGDVIEDTLGAAPSPAVTNAITTDNSGNVSGSTTVTNSQTFTITGYVNTSHGRVTTTVHQSAQFSNLTNVVSNATEFAQDATQTSTLVSDVTSRNGILVTGHQSSFSYPITVNFTETLQPNYNIQQTSTIDQKYQRNDTFTFEGLPVLSTSVSNEVKPADTATFIFNPAQGSYSLGANSNQSSSQTYTYRDSVGKCYSKTVEAAANVVTRVEDNQQCQGPFGQH